MQNLRQLTKKQTANGYITLELLLAISLMAIGLSLSISTYLSHNSRTMSAASYLYNLLHETRLLALIRQEAVTIYPLTSYNWTSQSIAIDINNVRYQTINIPMVPLTWRASLGNHQRVVFQPHGGTDGEQGRFQIGCQATYPCIQLIVNYNGHIQRLYNL